VYGVARVVYPRGTNRTGVGKQPDVRTLLKKNDFDFRRFSGD
jgi:hypothetical protein